MAAKYDVLIRGADVFDGEKPYPATLDIAIEGDRIADMGSLDGASGTVELSGDAMAVAPGFIDVHTHDDFAALSHRDMSFKSRGGVTTCIVGNCGFGAAPFDAAIETLGALTPAALPDRYTGHAGYAELLESNHTGINIGVLAGHGTFRKAVMGDVTRAPDDREMGEMKAHLNEALDAGVLGMSSGLIYEPGRNATTEELIELCAQMRDTGALYATHMRDEGEHLLDSVNEAIAIGAGAGVPVQISHHKASGRSSWGLVKESIRLIESAQARGESVHADQYPYTAGSTSLAAVLKNGIFTAGASGGFADVKASDVLVASAPDQPDWEGNTIETLSKRFDLNPLATSEKIVAASAGATVVLHMMSEDDVQFVMQHASTMIGSDGIPTLDGKPHPRLYNSFARVLGHYARDLGLFELGTAVYRMTGFAADKFGLHDRGRIKAGNIADLVLFDPATIIDKGTFEDPNQYPTGIRDVLVNGQLAVHNYTPTATLAGTVLRRAG